MSLIGIRSAALEDAPALASLSLELGYPTSTEQSEDRLRTILGSPDHSVIVAYGSDATIVGWVHVFRARRVESDPFAELGGFVVTEHLRGRGVGKRLLAAAEDWVREQRIEKLRVRCRTNRVDAHAFYERRGFLTTKKQNVLDKSMKYDA